MSFISQNHEEINSDDWTITKKTTRTTKQENFSYMKTLKVDRWALSLKAQTSNGSWRQGIKGEMTCTVYVGLVWNII